jgi:hypothetical protein
MLVLEAEVKGRNFRKNKSSMDKYTKSLHKKCPETAIKNLHPAFLLHYSSSNLKTQ